MFLVWVTSKRLENLLSLKVLTKIEVPRDLSALLVSKCEDLHPSIYQNGKDIFREYKLLFYQKCVFCFFLSGTEGLGFGIVWGGCKYPADSCVEV